jgi:hypothetical protein
MMIKTQRFPRSVVRNLLFRLKIPDSGPRIFRSATSHLVGRNKADHVMKLVFGEARDGIGGQVLVGDLILAVHQEEAFRIVHDGRGALSG